MALATAARISTLCDPCWDGIGFGTKRGHLSLLSGTNGIPYTDRVPPVFKWNESVELMADGHNLSRGTPPTGLRAFSDGSVKGTGKAGYGVVLVSSGGEELGSESGGIQGTVSPLQAEVVAIGKAADLLLRNLDGGPAVSILSDSRGALQAVSRPIIDSATVLDCHNTLSRLGKKCRVYLKWLKGHNSDLFNERADSLVRRGAGSRTNSRVDAPWSYLCINLRENMYDSWLRNCSSLIPCRQTREFFPSPKECPSATILDCSRKLLGLRIQLFTGHNRLNYHQFRIGRADSQQCRLCGEASETSDHLVWHCRTLSRNRMDYWTDNMTNPPTIRRILAFAEKFVMHLMI